MSLHIDIQQRNDLYIVTLIGRMDTFTESDFESMVLPLVNVETRFLLDMSAIEYMSSAGLKGLLLLSRQIAETNGQLVLVGVSDNIQNVMSLTGVLEFFTLRHTVADGLKMFQI